jgi:DNA-binding beta-propeller fold protein YncE
VFEPTAMAVAPAGSPYAGNLYITDIQYDRVDEFNPSGAMVGSWGSLSYPYGIAVDGQGYIYVANNTNLSPGNVLKFNPR